MKTPNQQELAELIAKKVKSSAIHHIQYTDQGAVRYQAIGKPAMIGSCWIDAKPTLNQFTVKPNGDWRNLKINLSGLADRIGTDQGKDVFYFDFYMFESIMDIIIAYGES